MRTIQASLTPRSTSSGVRKGHLLLGQGAHQAGGDDLASAAGDIAVAGGINGNLVFLQQGEQMIPFVCIDI